MRTGSQIFDMKEERRAQEASLQDFYATLGKAHFEERDITEDEAAHLDAILKENEIIDQRFADKAAEAERRAIQSAAPKSLMKATGKVGWRYRDMFNVASSHPFENAGEFFNAVFRRDPRLIVNTMTEGSGTAGGYLVPAPISAEMLDLIQTSSIVLSRAFLTPMTGQTKTLVSIDYSGAAITDLPLTWLAEGATGTRGTGVTKRVVMTARKAAIFADASSELAADGNADGASFEAQLSEALTGSAAYGLDRAFAFGAGAGSYQPVGYLTSGNGARIAVTRAGAGEIAYADLVSMVSRLHPRCYGAAVWYAHPTTLPQLLAVQRAVLNGSTPVGGDYLPVGSVTGRGLSMLGFPVVISENVAAPLGTLGDLSLIDLSGYAVGLRKDVSIESTVAAQWLNDKIDWRLILRTDGQTRWDLFSPRGALDSPATEETLSWCITLN